MTVSLLLRTLSLRSSWKIISFLAISMSLFHLYTGGVGVFTALIQRSIHLAFVLALIFLIFPAKKGTKREDVPLYDLLFAVIGVVSGIYLSVNYEQVALREGMPTQYEIWLGILTTGLLLEAVRRSIGWPMLIIAATFILYSFLGPYLPSALEHRGYSIQRLSYQLYLTESGIFGVPLGVCATIIYLFILFGAFLEQSGASKYFIQFALAITGRSRGGPAKAAVVSSALMGMVSGSAVANVVTTGTFTIPLMIKTGYKPHYAAAVEAVSSSGGQIMPPVMGAAAFIMAEMTGIPYVKICLAAAIPAFLFYASIYCVVHLEATKMRIPISGKGEISFLSHFLEGLHLFLPIGVLVYLLVLNYSPMYVAFWTILFIIVMSFTRRATRMNLKKILIALEDAAKDILPVSAACACAGIVIGVVTMTGLGLSFSSLLISWSGGSKLALLFLTMIASLILGMGLPTAPCYILLAVLVAPALERAGVPLIAAHLFIFYFGIISAITPPVALAAYAAAGLANADPHKVGYTACWIGIAKYIVPFMFVYGPALVNIGTTFEVFYATTSALIGIGALSIAVEGFFLQHCPFWQRAMMMMSALLLIEVGAITDLLGISIFLFIYLWQFIARKRGSQAEGNFSSGMGT